MARDGRGGLRGELWLQSIRRLFHARRLDRQDLEAGAARRDAGPIVFMGTSDPVGNGLVASLARPGGNITGISPMQTELMAKRLDLLSDLVPQARVIALLVATESQTERVIGEVQEAARAKRVELAVVKAGTESEIDAAFASLAQLHAGALIVAADPFFGGRRDQLV